MIFACNSSLILYECILSSFQNRECKLNERCTFGICLSNDGKHGHWSKFERVNDWHFHHLITIDIFYFYLISENLTWSFFLFSCCLPFSSSSCCKFCGIIYTWRTHLQWGTLRNPVSGPNSLGWLLNIKPWNA